MIEVLKAPLIDLGLILEDLNGTGRPNGLHALYLEFSRVAGLEFTDNLTTQGYRAQLCHYVDLWIEHRTVLERRRMARYSGGTVAVTSDEAQRAMEINRVVGRLASAFKVLPAIRDDSYTFSIAPTREVMFLPTAEPRHTPSGLPTSAVDPNQYPILEDYATALIKERFASTLVEEPKKLEKDQHQPRATRKAIQKASNASISAERSNEIAKNAAERIFMEMLASDWRQRIAKCADPHCKAPYFPLGKWRTVEKATFCLTCRQALKATHNQGRVEKNREAAKRQLRKFIAERFGSQISQGPAWRKDERRKSQMAEVVNEYIKKAGGALKSLYPNGITGKWFMSGQRHKNWKLIEARVERAQAQKAAGNLG